MKMKWLKHPALCGIVFFTIHILWFPTANGSNDKSQSAVIQVKNGMLTASIKETPLIDILSMLSNQTGIGFELYAETDRKISARYYRIPLEDGLKRLLRPSNYIILYIDKKTSSKRADIKKIIIYDSADMSSGQRIKQRATQSKIRSTVRGEDKIADTKPNTENSLAYYAKQLNEHDPDDREEAIRDMANEYEEAALIYLDGALIYDGNEDVRAAAAQEIGELVSERGIDILTKGLTDPDETVREAVVEALGEIGGQDALQALRVALKDDNEGIRAVAADLIDEIRDDEAENR